MPDPITMLKAGSAALDLTGKAISGLPRIMTWILVQPEAAMARRLGVFRSREQPAPTTHRHRRVGTRGVPRGNELELISD